MARKKRGRSAQRPAGGRFRLDARALARLAGGFAAGLAFWLAFSTPYEKTVAGAATFLLRAIERPAVSALTAPGGEFRVDRSDFPPASPRPGLPAADLHFNFVLLATLFALAPHPLAPRRFGRFWVAAGVLWTIHVIALVFQVEAVYATRLGAWSDANYGTVARNFWAAGFHFYQIAGRFAAPFVLWWGFGDFEFRDSKLEFRS
ncbi:MAG TPA: hypothetical protein VGG65_09770 [Thermoanaerobaculia bacterium]